MATLSGNPLLKWLAIPFVLLVVVMVTNMSGKQGGQQNVAGTPSIDATDAKALGVDGDTPGDTLRTVVAETRQLKDQLKKTLDGNEALKRDNQDLQARLRGYDQTINQRLESVQREADDKAGQRVQGMLESLQSQLDALSSGNPAASSDLPIGFGVQPGDGAGFQRGSQEVVWVEPEDRTARDASGNPVPAGGSRAASNFSYPTSFGAAADRGQTLINNSAQAIETQASAQDARNQVRKTFTLPQNSTLMGSVAMSALIGRVPIDGTVNDPYPFKVMIGPDNLTANGIDLPDVAGAIASGTASGDWTLSCVRGQIRSLTFVFNDGTVRTFPAPQEEGNGNNQNNNQTSSEGQQSIRGGLGWLSDPYGIPCIAGDRRSNAKEYLTNQSLLTAAGAGAAKILKADETTNSTSFSSGGTTFGSTGNTGNSALGAILTGGVSDIRAWMNKLYGEAFAAVYVQPGAKVAVHLDQQLAIDYELKGRKVDYSSGATHVSASLD